MGGRKLRMGGEGRRKKWRMGGDGGRKKGKDGRKRLKEVEDRGEGG